MDEFGKPKPRAATKKSDGGSAPASSKTGARKKPAASKGKPAKKAARGRKSKNESSDSEESSSDDFEVVRKKKNTGDDSEDDGERTPKRGVSSESSSAGSSSESESDASSSDNEVVVRKPAAKAAGAGKGRGRPKASASSAKKKGAPAKKAPAKKPAAGRKRKARKSDSEDDEEEEDEDDEDEVVTRKKRGRGAAKEAANDHLFSSEEEEEEFVHVYRESDLATDDKDAAWLMSLPELQREEELFRRREQREKAKEIWMTRQKMKNSDKPRPRREASRESTKKKLMDRLTKGKKAANKKAKAGGDKVFSDDDDDGDAVMKDVPTAGEKRREEERAQQQREADDRARGSTTGATQAAAAAAALAARGDGRRPLTLEQLESMRVPRDKLIEWVHEPFFKKFQDCFVRLGIGNKSDGTPVYRVCQVLGFPEMKPYVVQFQKKQVTLEVGAILKHGASTRIFEISSLSNHAFTESELAHWIKETNKAGGTFPTEEEVKQISHTVRTDWKKTWDYKAQEIDRLVDINMRARSKPVNIATHRSLLQSQYDEARLACDEAKEDDEKDKLLKLCEYISQELQKLEDFSAELEKKKDKHTFSVHRINSRHRQFNMQKKPSDPNSLNEDPTARRKCAPIMVWTSGIDTADSAQNKPANGSENNNADKKSNEASTQKPPTPGVTPRVPTLADAHREIGANFSIDIKSIQSSSNEIPILPVFNPRPVQTTAADQNRPTMSLSEWRQRRGL